MRACILASKKGLNYSVWLPKMAKAVTRFLYQSAVYDDVITCKRAHSLNGTSAIDSVYRVNQAPVAGGKANKPVRSWLHQLVSEEEMPSHGCSTVAQISSMHDHVVACKKQVLARALVRACTQAAALKTLNPL